MCDRSEGARSIQFQLPKPQPASLLSKGSSCLLAIQTRAGPQRRPQPGSLPRRGGSGTLPPQEYFQNKLWEREIHKECRSSTGWEQNPGINCAGLVMPTKLAWRGAAGSLSCPLTKLSLQRPGYFGTLEKAKFQMYHRGRSIYFQKCGQVLVTATRGVGTVPWY